VPCFVGIQGIVFRPFVASLIDRHTKTPCCLLANTADSCQAEAVKSVKTGSIGLLRGLLCVQAVCMESTGTLLA